MLWTPAGLGLGEAVDRVSVSNDMVSRWCHDPVVVGRGEGERIMGTGGMGRGILHGGGGVVSPWVAVKDSFCLQFHVIALSCCLTCWLCSTLFCCLFVLFCLVRELDCHQLLAWYRGGFS